MNSHRLHRFQRPITQIIILATCYLLLAILTGCEAFVRKFTRKPKKEAPKEEMVLMPEEYRPLQMSREEVYRQYFLFWKSWHDELINSLSGSASQKKQIDCINEAIKNLEQLRATLQEAKQKKLDIYISQLNELRGALLKDFYGNNVSLNRLTAERIKRNILRDFSYQRISKDISYGASRPDLTTH